jgi:hypothetical protein
MGWNTVGNRFGACEDDRESTTRLMQTLPDREGDDCVTILSGGTRARAGDFEEPDDVVEDFDYELLREIAAERNPVPKSKLKRK